MVKCPMGFVANRQTEDEVGIIDVLESSTVLSQISGHRFDEHLEDLND